MTDVSIPNVSAINPLMARTLLSTLGALSEMYDRKDGAWVDELRNEAATALLPDGQTPDFAPAELEEVRALLDDFRVGLAPCTSCIVAPGASRA